jgi:RNA polymerase sigma-70 factor (ECF subfamily)
MDDICQAVHGKLLESLRADRFQRQSTLKTYVGRITHYTAIDRIRRRYRERSISRDWVFQATPSGDNPYKSLARMEERAMLRQVLLRSPPGCRELWRLVFVERLSYAEIGRRLSIPPGTVKSRMWHCRRKALALLEQLKRGGSAKSGVRPGKE